MCVMPVHSCEMGMSGECDVAEFHRVKEGISLYGKEGFYRVVPIEYKRGKPKEGEEDILQLASAGVFAWKKCCVVKSSMDIFITVKSADAIR